MRGRSGAAEGSAARKPPSTGGRQGPQSGGLALIIVLLCTLAAAGYALFRLLEAARR